MRLYERYADKGFHTSIATTFGIDFDAYESIILPRLRGAGCRNNIVLADRRMLTYALSGASCLPRHAGKLYTVSGTGAEGVFHPKLFLQFGRRGGRMIISSANITASGLAGNLELMGLIECGDKQSGESRLIAQAWAYARRQISSDQQALRAQIEWMSARAPWLAQTEAAQNAERLGDGTLAAVLASGETTGIGERFAALIDEPVSRLIVISPYWDHDLGALSALADKLSAGEVSVLIDPYVMSFPKDAAANLASLKLHDRGEFREGRFIHAKTIIAQTESADHMLIGSANCTRAALGTAGFAGINEEICLYRQLPPGSVLKALELSSLLTDDNRIDPATLDAPVIEDDIPLEELAKQSPGQFEIRVDTLIWYPPERIDPATTKIELLDNSGAVMPTQLTLLASSAAERPRYQIGNLTEPPAFARLVYTDGQHSAKAVIALIDKLRTVIREAQSRQSEKLQHQLDGETDAHLSLLDILDVLEKIENDDRLQNEPRALPRAANGNEDDGQSEQHRKLTYEEFIRSRQPRTASPQTAHSTLEGSEVSIVRGFLNRILGVQPTIEEEPDEDASAIGKMAFNLGDETGNAQQALADGEEFGEINKEPETQETTSEDERKRKAQQKRATREQIVAAVARFHSRIKARREVGTLSNHDILRLRALLMVVCSAAVPPNAKAKSNLPDLKVLPAQGDSDSWPLLMGRLIFALFGGKKPTIHELILQSEHNQLPDDIIECWATCYWCLAACLSLPLSQKEKARLTAMLEPLAQKTYLLTLPSTEELLGDDIVTFMERMNARYGQQLGVDPKTIAARHRAIAGSLFEKTGQS